MVASSTSYRKATTPSEFLHLLGVGEERYCRYLWSKAIKKEDGAWRAIGHRQSGKTVTTLSEFVLRAERFIPARNSATCSVDVFLSPNQFFDWRCTPQLASLHANWIEIDTTGHAEVTAGIEAQICDEVLSQISSAGLPFPTGFVFSGSGGLHAYWIYDGPVEAFRWRVSVWREMAERLSNLPGTDKWHVDFGASHDPARVLRLPGSIHGGTGRIVNAMVGGQRYAFEALAEQLGISHVQPSAKVVPIVEKTDVEIGGGSLKHRPISQDAKSTKTGAKRHTIGQWWSKIYFHVVSHARLHGIKAGGPSEKGERDLYAFILYCALRHIKKDEQQAFDKLLELNEELIHLEVELLERYLSTARRTKYKFKKKTVVGYLSSLGICTDFLYQSKHRCLSSDEIKTAQRLSAATTAEKKRSKTMDSIKDAVQQLGSCSQQAIAHLTGLSTRTIRRYWQSVQRSLGLPVFNPPLGRLCPV